MAGHHECADPGRLNGGRPLSPPPAGRGRFLAAVPDGLLWWGLPLVVGLFHVALVAPHYHVGSFDDDAAYTLGARTLLWGGGFTGNLASGVSMIGLFPPGFSALIAPLVWLWPHSYTPLRLLSVVCFAGLFPLTWIYLGHRGFSRAVRSAVLLVVALSPPLATFGSMVMAETPFLVVLLLLLLAVERWAADPRVLSGWTVAVVAASAELLWLKQAGLGLVVGLVIWTFFARVPARRAKAAVLAAGTGLLLSPVLIARAAAGVPLAGGRYSQELGGFYNGGLVSRLEQVLPHSLWHLLATAVPATLVPYLEPLPIAGHWPDLWKLLSWQVTLLAAVGAYRWVRGSRDPGVVMAAVYLAECSLWPFVNERRAVLVLPLLAAWYVDGGVTVWRFVRRHRPSGLRRATSTALVVAAAAAVLVPLVAQSTRDYLFSYGQSSSSPQNSRYMRILAALGRPSDVVETDYLSTTALFSGHRTNWNAFIDSEYPVCYLPGIFGALQEDRAAYLLLGDLNKPGLIDNGCLASLADGSAWAVPLLHTSTDNGVVYELVGPHSANPDLTDLLTGLHPDIAADGADLVWTWTLPRPRALSQLSLGETGPARSVALEVLTPAGWTRIASTVGGVGDGRGQTPFLLSAAGTDLRVSGVRVVIAPAPAAPAPVVSDLAAVGPS